MPASEQIRVADPQLVRHLLGKARFEHDEDLEYRLAAIEHAFWANSALEFDFGPDDLGLLAAEEAACRQALEERRQRGYVYQRPVHGYDRDYLDELKRRVPILDVLGGAVKLRRSGKNYVGLCPFHQERTPSFTVYPATNSYYCFGCQHYGDAIDWLREIAGMRFREAVETLEVLAGLPMSQPRRATPPPGPPVAAPATGGRPAQQVSFVVKNGKDVQPV